MKISSYYKQHDAEVELKTDYTNLQEYDIISISKVFTDTQIDNEILKLPNVVYGGTGFYYDKAPMLPDYIEHIMPDYSLYTHWAEQQIAISKNPQKARQDLAYYFDYSIGFTTRGCVRGCPNCVNRNYKKCNVHSPIHEFLDTSKRYICLLDDNVFACKNWREIFQELQQTNVPFQFKQGLDERLLTDDKCEELFVNSRWRGDYIFAFDYIKDKDLIVEKAKLIRKWHNVKGQDIKFYVFCGFDEHNIYDMDFWRRDIDELFERIFVLAQFNFKPYIMRFNKYAESPFYGTYVNIAAWANQPSLFSNLSYHDFCIKDDVRKSGGAKTSATWRYYNILLDKHPEATKWLKIVPKHVEKLYTSTRD